MSEIQDGHQHYAGDLAANYGGFEDCEANTYGWAEAQLAELSPGKKVVDVGCGKGLRFPFFKNARSLIGIEAGDGMIADLPSDVDVIRWKNNPEVVCDHMRFNNRLVIHGQLQDVCHSGVIRANVAANLFNVICFPAPHKPINAMHSGLKAGGKMVVTTNTFVPKSLDLSSRNFDDSMEVDLHDLAAYCPDVNPGVVFRQVLHLKDDDGEHLPLPLEDNVHSMQQIANALSDDAWSMVEARLFRPQGCTHIDPDEPGPFEGLHDDIPKDHPILIPGNGAGLEYAKLCFVAEKI